MKLYRHGDVLIAPAAQIPQQARRLAHLMVTGGDSTGHAHRVIPAGQAELLSFQSQLYLRITDAPARVVHEEHQPIELSPGIYRVWRQRQYEPPSAGQPISAQGGWAPIGD